MRNGWPSYQGVALVSAALSTGRSALEAYRLWRSRSPEGPAAAEERILPLCWWNLRRFLDDEPSLAETRESFQAWWARNAALLACGGEVAGALREKGVPVVALKGAALAGTVFPSPGARPMSDVDLLVPARAAANAIALLEGLGFRHLLAMPPTSLPHLHSVGLARDDGFAVDVHRCSLPGGSRGADDEPLWGRAQPGRLGGEEILIPAPEDSLLIALVHGPAWSEPASLLWPVDAILLLRKSDSFDWDLVAAEAIRRRHAHSAERALAWLVRRLAADVPPSILSRLRRSPDRAGGLAEAWARCRPPSLARGVYLHWRSCRRSHEETRGALRSFPVYLQQMWGIDGSASLLPEAGRRSLERLRRLRGMPR